jgi:hypothetical protein
VHEYFSSLGFAVVRIAQEQNIYDIYFLTLSLIATQNLFRDADKVK